jgi:hypothetical protein
MRQPRVFEDSQAIRSETPLIVGLNGESFSGKTYTALELATGIQSVTGGEIYGVDTEGGRMKHYAEYFKFRHVPFSPPFGPLDYLDVINHCAKKKAKIVVMDSMSHEHDGEGGVLDQIEDYLNEKAQDDWKKREKLLFAANIKPKTARKALNRRILQLTDIIWILCYRADDKIKPRKGEQPDNLGLQPITTSKLRYEMVVRFFFRSGSGGVPVLNTDNEHELRNIKMPRQFEGWFKPGERLSRLHGERLIRWAAGGIVTTTSDELRKLSGMLVELGLDSSGVRQEWIEGKTGRKIESPKDLTPDEIASCLALAKSEMESKSAA